jgi:hypothetical protein
VSAVRCAWGEEAEHPGAPRDNLEGQRDFEKNALIVEYGPLFWSNKNALKNGKIFANAWQ